ncbi:MAG TPA: DUF4112 domain-containing protein [Alphaproteobacteria bacterium]|nr:DUF4112 domain-containing protein [Alphaproteobacteria bacterium]
MPKTNKFAKPSGVDPAEDLHDLEQLASWMDDRFRLPGTQIRFGVDPILGLIPGIGDSVTALTAGYMIGRARALGVPLSTRLRMMLNVILDVIVGTIPLFGDLFDVGFRANRRNLELIRRHVQKRERGNEASSLTRMP